MIVEVLLIYFFPGLIAARTTLALPKTQIVI